MKISMYMFQPQKRIASTIHGNTKFSMNHDGYIDDVQTNL